MRHSFRAVLLSATVLALVASPSFSRDLNANPSQDDQSAVRIVAGDFREAGEAPPAPAPHLDDGEHARPQWPGDEGPGGLDRAGPPPVGRPDHPGLGLAARLAATETYVGITAGQLDAWRAYTSALIDFLENAGPGPGPDRQWWPAPPGGEDAAKPSPDAAPFFAERLADRAIAQGEKAKALKQAIDALRPVLRPEQLERLAKAEPAFPPPHPALDPDGHGAGRQGPGGEGFPPPAEDD